VAYFPNGSAGTCFDEQCSRCRFGDSACPIALAQGLYNYDACNVPVARAILDSLVHDDGTCAMFAMDPGCFRSDERNQMALEFDASLTTPQQPADSRGGPEVKAG